MQRNNGSQSAHRKVQASTTLNRKYVKRPAKKSDITVAVKRSPKISHFHYPAARSTTAQAGAKAAATQAAARTIAPQTNTNASTVKATTPQTATAKIERPTPHPLQTTANTKLRARSNSLANTTKASQLSAKELKDQAIKKALAAAETSDLQQESTRIKNERLNKIHFGFGRVMLALACTTAAVFAIVYFVNLNMPDISLRVAAMQTGINASYPGYVPRGYSVSSITSEEGKIVLDFSSNEPQGAFTLIEEKSSWDSNALLSNYVQPEWEENYTMVREQGITIYINGSNAAWVNGGIVYKINTSAGNLTNKQIRSIAVSL